MVAIPPDMADILEMEVNNEYLQEKRKLFHRLLL